MEKDLALAAYELTMMFQDESDIPGRLKKDRTARTSKQSSDNSVEKRFQQHIKAWTFTLHSIVNNVPDQKQAMRFIKRTPEVLDRTINSVTKCQDFLDFTDLLIKRRDVDNCGDDELGKLSMIHSAFQRQVEKQINQ
jgi:hypothetical protein